MVPRPLGRTGLRVSPIALGTVKLGRNTQVKYPASFPLPTEAEALRLLEDALALGVNLFDTAPAYGESELRLAPFVAAHRGRIVLGSKCGEWFEGGRSSHDFSAARLTASVESSLRRLGTDHLDLLLLHSDGRDVEILTKTDARAVLARLKAQGKIRAAGISAKTPEGIDEASRGLDVVMAPFSLGEPGLGASLARAHAAGLGVLAVKGLQSGRLAAKAPEAVRFVLDQPFIDTLVLGTLRIEHLREVVEAAQGGAPGSPGSEHARPI